MNWPLNSPIFFVIPFVLFLLLLIFLEILFFRFLFRKLNISMTGVAPKSVLRLAYKNLAVTLLLLVGLCSCLTSVFHLIFQQSIKDSIVFSIGIGYGAAIIYSLYKWAVDRRQSRNLVFEIAPGPVNKNVFFLNALNAIILGLFIGFALDLTRYAHYTTFALGFLLALLNVLFATGRLQIYENGIWMYIYFLKWSEIESYIWKEENKKFSPLHIKINWRLPSFFRNGALMVPIEKKETVESLLQQYLPDKQGVNP